MKSPYLRDRLAELPMFRDRGRPLPITPEARATRATFDRLPRHDRAKEFASRGLPPELAAIPSAGDLLAIYDPSIPDGLVDIDGTRVSIDDLCVAIQDWP